VGCSPKSSSRLSVGWSRFAEENKLQVGDAFVFELINKEDCVLDVHIFRGNRIIREFCTTVIMQRLISPYVPMNHIKLTFYCS